MGDNAGSSSGSDASWDRDPETAAAPQPQPMAPPAVRRTHTLQPPRRPLPASSPRGSAAPADGVMLTTTAGRRAPAVAPPPLPVSRRPQLGRPLPAHSPSPSGSGSEPEPDAVNVAQVTVTLEELSAAPVTGAGVGAGAGSGASAARSGRRRHRFGVDQGGIDQLQSLKASLVALVAATRDSQWQWNTANKRVLNAIIASIGGATSKEALQQIFGVGVKKSAHRPLLDTHYGVKYIIWLLSCGYCCGSRCATKRLSAPTAWQQIVTQLGSDAQQRRRRLRRQAPTSPYHTTLDSGVLMGGSATLRAVSASSRGTLISRGSRTPHTSPARGRAIPVRRAAPHA